MSLSHMPMNTNGWVLYHHRVFKAVLDDLEAVVTQLSLDDPRGYQTHPKTKLLASVYKSITESVPAKPEAAEFRLNKSFGVDNTNWRRIRKGQPDPYRLFFRFASTPVKAIVYVWFNNENTLGGARSKANVYETFIGTLARGVVPRNIGELMSLASAAE